MLLMLKYRLFNILAFLNIGLDSKPKQAKMEAKIYCSFKKMSPTSKKKTPIMVSFKVLMID